MNILGYFSDYGIKPSGNNQYTCRCPSHDDKSPSLTITDVGDKILVHCFAGCEPEDIVNAVGLSISDLFAEDGEDYKKEKHIIFQREQFMSDYRIVKLGESDIKRGKDFSLEDRKVFRDAISRINKFNFDADEAYKNLINQDYINAELENAFYNWQHTEDKYND